jgi:hypothetical protein
MRIKFTSNIKYSLFLIGMILSTNSINAQFQKGNDIDGEIAGDAAGWYVSMPDANTLAIGERFNDDNGTDAGQVRIFTWNTLSNGWVQKGSDLNGDAINDSFGYSISMPDANTVAIGAPFNDGNGGNAGHVKIFSWNGLAWIQKGNNIEGEVADDLSGWSVSMSDSNTVAIGARLNDNNNGTDAGHVRIYGWNSTTDQWVQKGSDIDGESVVDLFGWSVSMPDSNTVAIGATLNDGNLNASGHVRIYSWNGLTWLQKGSDIDGESPFDNSGHSVSMPDANTVAISAYQNDGNGSNSGHVRVYNWNGLAWVQKGSDIDGEAANDGSGYSISMPDSNTVAIGARNNDGSFSDAGHVRIYKWNGLAWLQAGNDIDGEAVNDNSGYSVSMPDANTVTIGSPWNDGNGIDAGHVRVYSLCSPSTGTDILTDCDSYTWIDGITYTSSNNTATHILTNATGCDSVVTLNLTINYSNSGTDTQTACGSFTWIDGNTYTSSNSIATHTLTNTAGCDSLVTLNLTINTFNTGVTNNSPTLSANATGVTYQWINCNNGNTVIAGATNQSFTATVNGNYAVIVTQNGCSDTSACVAINNLGISDNNFGEDLLIYPNPTNGEFKIEGLTKGTTIELFNAIGLVALRLKTEDTTTKIDLSSMPAGVYFISTEINGIIVTKRIVKK